MTENHSVILAFGLGVNIAYENKIFYTNFESFKVGWGLTTKTCIKLSATL